MKLVRTRLKVKNTKDEVGLKSSLGTSTTLPSLIKFTYIVLLLMSLYIIFNLNQAKVGFPHEGPKKLKTERQREKREREIEKGSDIRMPANVKPQDKEGT